MAFSIPPAHLADYKVKVKHAIGTCERLSGQRAHIPATFVVIGRSALYLVLAYLAS
jgi:hypothetical protein